MARRVLSIVGLVLAAGLILKSALPMEPGLDYFTDAGAPIDALARGDWSSFLADQPLMGPLSLYLRAPFVATVFHESERVVYFVGALPCLAALVALGLYLRRRMLSLGRPLAAAGLVAILCILNPGTFRALHWGHPEELLGAALCVGAVLAAVRGRDLAAGVLLGLALATKQWALVAFVPVVLAAPAHRLRLAAVSIGLAAALMLPSFLDSTERFTAAHRRAADATNVVSAANVWWPFAYERTQAERRASNPNWEYAQPPWLGRLTHPLIVLLTIPLGWLFLRRRERRGPYDVLGLLALAMLLRCLLDPWNNDYYHAPFLVALVAWEGLGRDGWPRLALVAGAALSLTFPAEIVSQREISEQALRISLVYLAWAVPMATYVALALFAPDRLERLSRRLRLSERSARLGGPGGTPLAGTARR